jgi:Cu2+-exporting ATPase
MTPEDKLTAVRHHRGNAPVIMIGDGVNDAAALAAANAGVAVHGGAEASLAAAEVYVAIPGMASVVPLFIAARRVMQTVRRNLLISLAYNLIVGILAATGRMNPLIAAILMPISSASVLFLSVASVRKIGQVRS